MEEVDENGKESVKIIREQNSIEWEVDDIRKHIFLEDTLQSVLEIRMICSTMLMIIKSQE